ncbi:MAG: glycerol-3-phosphate dehydrogenase/oxidase [Pseudomonadota bacterium]
MTQPSTPTGDRRQKNLARLAQEPLDVLILGGGINGASAAASLSARGLKVGLVDRADFASGTSSQTSNLAWGGIKYLESGEVGLVRSLCRSRNRLMAAYPASIREMRFLTSVPKGFRKPAWLVYAGALLYWALGSFHTGMPRYLRRGELKRREPAIAAAPVAGAFEYSDAFFVDNDARFVFSFIRRALDHGAAIANYVEATAARRTGGRWEVELKDARTGQSMSASARILINTCGPQADAMNSRSQVGTRHHHILSKGVHLIVDQVTPNPRVLTFFASDGRPFFIIPMGRRTCIGTTDTPSDHPEVTVTEADREFLLDNANRVLALARPLDRDDIIAERCGVRPLATDGQSATTDWIALSRKHHVEVKIPEQHISVFGGKFTDCLNIGEELADAVASLGLPLQASQDVWYGEGNNDARDTFTRQAKAQSLDDHTAPHATEPLSERYWRRYGAGALRLLEVIAENPELAQTLTSELELTHAELAFVADREMVTRLDDFLRRRTRISLVHREGALRSSGALQLIAKALFGDAAGEAIAEYENRSAQEVA